MQTDPLLPNPRSFQLLDAEPTLKYRKVTHVQLTDSLLHFWDGECIAVSNMEVLYILDHTYTAVQTRYLNETARPNLASIRVSPRDFDFIVGSCLTKTGLQLTRAPRDSDA